MAIIRNNQYPGLWNSPSINSPQGNFRNETVDGAEDGSYLDRVWKNDEDAVHQSLLIAAGITPDGNPDEGGNSQVFQALIEQAAGRASYAIEVAGSSSTAYVIEESVQNQAPQSLFDGMTLTFKTAYTNTTSTPTINAFGLGPVTAVNFNGSPLESGQIRSSSNLNTVIYNATSNLWLLIDRREFDSKLSGLSYSGFTESLGVDIDTILKNSVSYYGLAIPGVTASPTDGVLTVKMSSSQANGGVQTFFITDRTSPQLGQKWVRFIDNALQWGDWVGPDIFEPAVPGFDVGMRSARVSNFNANLFLALDTDIPLSAWVDVGRAGSGATYEWAGFSQVPASAKQLIVVPSVSTLDNSAGSRNLIIRARVPGLGFDTIFFDNRVLPAGGGSMGINVGERSIPLDDNGIFEIYWSTQWASTQFTRLKLVGWMG